MDDSLANGALHWMCEQAADQGLTLNDDYLSFFRKYPAGSASSKSNFYKVSDQLLRPIRGFGGIRKLAAAPGAKIDGSALERLNADPAKHENLEKVYRPKKLVAHLVEVTL